MNDDTIYRQAAIESVDMLFRPFTEYSPGMVDLAGVACNHTLADVIVTLKALPSAERYGRWIPDFGGKFKGGAYWFRCSMCGRIVPNVRNGYMNYCPNCGAKMEGAEE